MTNPQKQHGASANDIANVEAWSNVIQDLLSLAPREKREAIFKAVSEWNTKELAEPKFKLLSIDDILAEPDRPEAAIERLKSLLIQVFARDITNENSPEDAAKILFARQSHGYGSGELLDYIADLVQEAA